MANNPGTISIVKGTYSNECTTQYDLIANQAVVPAIRDMLEYTQRRMFTTLLTNNILGPYGLNNPGKTKIPNVESKGKAIGNDAYEFRVMGRIEKPSTILSQVGASQSNGMFSLKMADNDLHKGDVVAFYGGRFQASVLAQPRGQNGAWIYDFQTPSGIPFNWTTHVAGQPGPKTCFPIYTAFGERSTRGYGESKFPDMFINHMTIQRNTIEITGDAASRVLWFNFTDATGGNPGKGWMYEEIAQQKAKVAIKTERQRLFGVSTMKDTDGTLRSVSSTTDPETGLPVIAGDGLEEQMAGGNVLYASGTNGQPTLDDYRDMMKTIEKQSNEVDGLLIVMVTGTDGYANFQAQAANLAGAQGFVLMDNVQQEGKAGGAAVNVGYNFAKINMNGNSLWVVKHPGFDDALAYPERNSNGDLILSSTCFFWNLGDGADKNIEVLHKAANGIDRSNVEAKLNGMTGSSEVPVTQTDAMLYAVLQQTMIVMYNTKTSGIIYPAS